MLANIILAWMWIFVFLFGIAKVLAVMVLIYTGTKLKFDPKFVWGHIPHPKNRDCSITIIVDDELIYNNTKCVPWLPAGMVYVSKKGSVPIIAVTHAWLKEDVLVRDFVLYHELGHLYFGHLDEILASGKRGIIRNGQWEGDADAFACGALMRRHGEYDVLSVMGRIFSRLPKKEKEARYKIGVNAYQEAKRYLQG